jgi:molydopterin dinucleotide binding protein
VRWQKRDAASALAADEPSTQPLTDPPAAPEGLRVAVAPTFWAGPEVEHSPSLHFLATGPRAELSIEDARALGVDSGDEARVSVGVDSVTAVVAVRTGVPAGCVFVSGGWLPEGEGELAPARRAVAVAAAGEAGD